MRWLSKYMGASTHSSLDRIVIARYFTFLVISQLVFFTVIGVIFSEYIAMSCTSFDSCSEQILSWKLSSLSKTKEQT